MKKLFSALMLVASLLFAFGANAQVTKSYAAVSAVGSTGPISTPTLAISITYYDGFLMLNGSTRCNYYTTNYDGSMQFYPQTSDHMGTTGILVSSDYSAVRQISQSNMFGTPMQMSIDYRYLGEGSQPAYNYMGASGSYSSPGYGGGSSGRDWSDCSSCRGSGNCKYCGGSGRDAYTRDGRCGVCRGTGHCAGCDGKGGYYY